MYRELANNNRSIRNRYMYNIFSLDVCWCRYVEYCVSLQANPTAAICITYKSMFSMCTVHYASLIFFVSILTIDKFNPTIAFSILYVRGRMQVRLSSSPNSNNEHLKGNVPGEDIHCIVLHIRYQ